MNQILIPNPKIAFVQARWHADIVDRCRAGFLDELAKHGRAAEHVDIVDVPGSFDIPLPARRLAETGRYAAIVAAGFVVDGGIYRHDFVAATVVEALMKVQLETGVPIVSAVLAPHQFQEQEPHLEYFRQHFVTKGKEAAGACLQIIDCLNRIGETGAIAVQDQR